MPNKKKHWTQTRAGRQKLKEIAKEKRVKKPQPLQQDLEEAANKFNEILSIEKKEAEDKGYKSAMATLDNRAREAQIELAKALGNVAHAIAVFVGEWRR